MSTTRIVLSSEVLLGFSANPTPVALPGLVMASWVKGIEAEPVWVRERDWTAVPGEYERKSTVRLDRGPSIRVELEDADAFDSQVAGVWATVGEPESVVRPEVSEYGTMEDHECGALGSLAHDLRGDVQQVAPDERWRVLPGHIDCRAKPLDSVDLVRPDTGLQPAHVIIVGHVERVATSCRRGTRASAPQRPP
jgi:hypothetical protein